MEVDVPLNKGIKLYCFLGFEKDVMTRICNLVSASEHQ